VKGTHAIRDADNEGRGGNKRDAPPIIGRSNQPILVRAKTARTLATHNKPLDADFLAWLPLWIAGRWATFQVCLLKQQGISICPRTLDALNPVTKNSSKQKRPEQT
jgi:hypothetical protein